MRSILLALACISVSASASEGAIIGFEGIAPSNSDVFVQPFTPIGDYRITTSHAHIFDSAFLGVFSYTSNGTDSMLVDNTSFALSRNDSLGFSLQSFQSTEYSNQLSGGNAIDVTGFFVGGGTISASFVTAPHVPTTAASPYQTFTFSSSWTNLASVSFATPSASLGFDNIQVDAPAIATTPEPATMVMWGLGMAGVGIVGVRRRWKKHASAVA